jgi:hypothetical protein
VQTRRLFSWDEEQGCHAHEETRATPVHQQHRRVDRRNGAGDARKRLGRRIRRAGEDRPQDRVHSPHRLRLGGDANVKGFDKKYGLSITPTKEASWAR